MIGTERKRRTGRACETRRLAFASACRAWFLDPSYTLLMLMVLMCGGAVFAGEPQPRIAKPDQRSGRAFMSADTQREQDDLSINPGMLWVESGEKLWSQPAGASGKACAGCHGEPLSMKGVATRYPLFDRRLGRLLNLEGRIQNCRSEHQSAPVPAYESEELLSLTALVANQARGLPMSVTVDGPAQQTFEAGRALYYQRQGQLNLSCGQCHEDNWGKQMRSDPLSQGQSNGYPVYRLEWQTMGSLHRRLKSCFFGVRAEPFAAGSPEFLALELFLAWRAQGLPVETPAIRR